MQRVLTLVARVICNLYICQHAERVYSHVSTCAQCRGLFCDAVILFVTYANNTPGDSLVFLNKLNCPPRERGNASMRDSQAGLSADHAAPRYCEYGETYGVGEYMVYPCVVFHGHADIGGSSSSSSSSSSAVPPDASEESDLQIVYLPTRGTIHLAIMHPSSFRRGMWESSGPADSAGAESTTAR